MSTRNHKLYLIDIVEAMKAIEKFVEGIDFETLRNPLFLGEKWQG